MDNYLTPRPITVNDYQLHNYRANSSSNRLTKLLSILYLSLFPSLISTYRYHPMIHFLRSPLAHVVQNVEGNLPFSANLTTNPSFHHRRHAIRIKRFMKGFSLDSFEIQPRRMHILPRRSWKRGCGKSKKNSLNRVNPRFLQLSGMPTIIILIPWFLLPPLRRSVSRAWDSRKWDQFQGTISISIVGFVSRWKLVSKYIRGWDYVKFYRCNKFPLQGNFIGANCRKT